MRHWFQADRSQLVQRVFALESELAVAAGLLELREEMAEERGDKRSAVVTELQAKWRKLLDERPVLQEEARP